MQTQAYTERNIPIPSESLPIYERVMTFMATNNAIDVTAYTNKIYFAVGKRKVIIMRKDVDKLNRDQAKAFFANNIYNPLKGKK
jgi:hypothetical protein